MSPNVLAAPLRVIMRVTRVAVRVGVRVGVISESEIALGISDRRLH